MNEKLPIFTIFSHLLLHSTIAFDLAQPKRKSDLAEYLTPVLPDQSTGVQYSGVKLLALTIFSLSCDVVVHYCIVSVLIN